MDPVLVSYLTLVVPACTGVYWPFKLCLVDVFARSPPPAADGRRAGVAARRGHRLNPLYQHMNERGCLERRAWLQCV